MLGHLLAGGEGHPSTEAARDAIMASDEAVGNLEVHRAERVEERSRLDLRRHLFAVRTGGAGGQRVLGG